MKTQYSYKESDFMMDQWWVLDPEGNRIATLTDVADAKILCSHLNRCL